MCAIISIKVDRLYLGKVEYITLFKEHVKRCTVRLRKWLNEYKVLAA